MTHFQCRVNTSRNHGSVDDEVPSTDRLFVANRHDGLRDEPDGDEERDVE